jgi:hypothetical protein
MNKSGNFLSAFHSGDMEVKGMFPCSKNSWIIFETKQKALDYKNYMVSEVLARQSKFDFELMTKMVDFINKLKIVS